MGTRKTVAPAPAWTRLAPWGVTLLLIVWFGFFFFHPIDLIPADLGRHITNGRIFFTQPEARSALLHTNFYSAATGAAPFVNHHWLTGVIFYLVWKLAGFTGLSVLHLSINLTTFLLWLNLLRRRAGFPVAAALAAMATPLLAERAEIRPEIFTYLGVMLYLTVIDGYLAGRLRQRALLVLIPIQLLWVNLHIYFFLGPFIAGVAWFSALIQKPERAEARKNLLLTLIAVTASSLVNPSGLAGLLYPLRIFNNYAFLVSENQSIGEYLRAGRGYANLWSFLILFLAAIVGFLTLRIAKARIEARDLILTVIFGSWGMLAIRNITLFGYIAALALAGIMAVKWRPTAFNKRWLIIFGAACLVGALAGGKRVSQLAPATRLGLAAGNDQAARFLLDHEVKGPLFNDFDIGGYAIFYLYPNLRPLADNRPEAYPAAFMQGEFIPMQMDNEAWQKAAAKYNFNVILYSFEDRAPWATQFIVRRILDQAWAPVYADNFAIIFLRRSPQNAELIKNYEISQERFSLRGS